MCWNVRHDEKRMIIAMVPLVSSSGAIDVLSAHANTQYVYDVTNKQPEKKNTQFTEEKTVMQSHPKSAPCMLNANCRKGLVCLEIQYATDIIQRHVQQYNFLISPAPRSRRTKNYVTMSMFVLCMYIYFKYT